MTSAEDFFYHLYRATDLYDDGHFDEARAELQHAEALDASDPRATDLRSKLANAPASRAHPIVPANATTGRSAGSPRATRLAELIELSLPLEAKMAVRLDALRAFDASAGALLERVPRLPSASALLGGASRPFVTLQCAHGQMSATAMVGPRAAHRLELLPIEREAPLFVREELLLAFDLALTYECARLADAELDIVQLRAVSGAPVIAIDPTAALTRMNVSSASPLHVRRDRLVAWTGRLMPQPIPPSDALASQRGLVRLSGDGAVLLSLA